MTLTETQSRAPAPSIREPRIGILVVAYNAAGTLARTLDRIPEEFRPRISEVIVSDDASTDATYLVGLGYQQAGTDLPLTVIRQEQNLGYGGNQKAGYRLAIEHGLDIVVLLHGDGQYAPEALPDLLLPLERGEADAVFGSRMMTPGGALSGGTSSIARGCAHRPYRTCRNCSSPAWCSQTRVRSSASEGRADGSGWCQVSARRCWSAAPRATSRTLAR